ncbi:MAG: extracellular solute-binding protein [Caldilineaceae bacterium]|nr:extracellular solute-binding protein [Caldilineaceae bacterium]
MDTSKFSRRDFLQRAAFVTMGASAATALAACQPAATVSDDAAAGDAAPMSEPVELSLWTFGSFFTDFYEAIFPAYKEIAPDVTIEVQEIPGGQLFDNLIASFAAGTGAPDIADIEQGSMSRFFKGEIGLIDLTT